MKEKIISHLTDNWQFYLNIFAVLATSLFVFGGIYSSFASVPRKVDELSEQFMSFRENDFRNVQMDVQTLKGYITGRDGIRLSHSSEHIPCAIEKL